MGTQAPQGPQGLVQGGPVLEACTHTASPGMGQQAEKPQARDPGHTVSSGRDSFLHSPRPLVPGSQARPGHCAWEPACRSSPPDVPWLPGDT